MVYFVSGRDFFSFLPVQTLLRAHPSSCPLVGRDCFITDEAVKEQKLITLCCSTSYIITPLSASMVCYLINVVGNYDFYFYLLFYLFVYLRVFLFINSYLTSSYKDFVIIFVLK